MIDPDNFQAMALEFLHTILARPRPVAVTDAEKIFLHFLSDEDAQGRF